MQYGDSNSLVLGSSRERNTEMQKKKEMKKNNSHPPEDISTF